MWIGAESDSCVPFHKVACTTTAKMCCGANLSL